MGWAGYLRGEREVSTPTADDLEPCLHALHYDLDGQFWTSCQRRLTRSGILCHAVRRSLSQDDDIGGNRMLVDKVSKLVHDVTSIQESESVLVGGFDAIRQQTELHATDMNPTCDVLGTAIHNTTEEALDFIFTLVHYLETEARHERHLHQVKDGLSLQLQRDSFLAKQSISAVSDQRVVKLASTSTKFEFKQWDIHIDWSALASMFPRQADRLSIPGNLRQHYELGGRPLVKKAVPVYAAANF
ncbi:hypothetical protein LTR56_007452 [Elasticomyces elasticus]|nr:hypothetical protein LTR56_007452 [Elasticomyces elasticus]KAK3668226.1 hypothetical protein LTR22_000911 [Elasticomyces elasticus]